MCEIIQQDLKNLDTIQINLLKESCIKIDNNDNVLGSCSKMELHQWNNINNDNLLHRAFSVFCFDNIGRLLIQKWAETKITFPLYWANTCCSHPLYIDKEMIIENNLGVINAAIRKLNHELGIDDNQISIDDFQFITKIHYK